MQNREELPALLPGFLLPFRKISFADCGRAGEPQRNFSFGIPGGGRIGTKAAAGAACGLDKALFE